MVKTTAKTKKINITVEQWVAIAAILLLALTVAYLILRPKPYPEVYPAVNNIEYAKVEDMEPCTGHAVCIHSPYTNLSLYKNDCRGFRKQKPRQFIFSKRVSYALNT